MRAKTLLLVLLACLLLPPPVQAGVTFDGVDDFMQGNGGTVLECTTTCTITFWVKTTVITTRAFLAHRNSSTGGWVVGIDTTNKYLFAFANDASSNNVALRLGTGAINTGAWFHIAVVLTTSTTVNANNTISLYVNGVLAQGALTHPSANVYATNGNDPRIARDPNAATFTAGTLDQLTIYSGALSAGEIATLADGRLRGTALTATPIRGWWMESCTHGASADGLVFPDFSGNGGATNPADNGANNTGLTCDTASAGLMYQRGVE